MRFLQFTEVMVKDHTYYLWNLIYNYFWKDVDSFPLTKVKQLALLNENRRITLLTKSRTINWMHFYRCCVI